MSRKGKVPIKIPDKVKVKLENGCIFVDGPKGKLDYKILDVVDVNVDAESIQVTRRDNEAFSRSVHGLTRALIANMVTGVSEGFKRNLEINGVGYRADTKGRTLVMSLGFSHPVEYAIPEGIDITVEKQTAISVSGCDKELVGQVAANIRGFKPPEPFKGKGIKYAEEVIRRKAGKTAGK